MTGNKGNTKNTITKHSTKPEINNLPNVPRFQNFKKPDFRGPNFNTSNAFRNQNRGSGGK